MKKDVRLMLADKEGNYVEAQVGDVVSIRRRSNGAERSVHGIIDGFTQERVRVVIDGSVSFFLPSSLAFVENGVYRGGSYAMTPYSEVARAVGLLGAGAKEEDKCIPKNDGLDEVKNEFSKFQDDLEKTVRDIVMASVEFNALMARVSGRFEGMAQAEEVEEFKRVVCEEVERRMEGFKEFVSCAGDKMLSGGKQG